LHKEKDMSAYANIFSNMSRHAWHLAFLPHLEHTPLSVHNHKRSKKTVKTNTLIRVTIHTSQKEMFAQQNETKQNKTTSRVVLKSQIRRV
jgi:hypothetical protein